MSTILLIEDNAEILDNYREYLQLEGFGIITARNSKEGVSLAKQHLPLMIICDIFLPALNGFHVFRQLSKFPGTSQIPFIFSSCMSESKDKIKALKLGACEYLTKPIEMETLVKVIRKHLENQISFPIPETKQKHGAI